jgi:hypothetical protein
VHREHGDRVRRDVEADRDPVVFLGDEEHLAAVGVLADRAHRLGVAHEVFDG